jgi:hypothetical protein
VAAQPTIDGNCNDAEYANVGSYTQGHGFGDFGLIAMHTAGDGTNFYGCLAGTAESNFNKMVVWIDVVQLTTGIPSGTQLPAVGSGLGLSNATPTLDLPTTEYAIHFTHGNSPIEGYASIITYNGGAGTATEQFLGGPLASDGTALSVGGGAIAFQVPDLSLTQTANQNLSDNSGTQGYEFSIPLANIGATSSSEVQLFAAYVNSDGSFFSSDVIPEVPGNGSDNFGGSPDFTALAGTQATGLVALPVELAAFTAQLSGERVALAWETASETNNAGFAVEMSDLGAFREIGFVSGAGTSLEAQAYGFTTDRLEPGTYTFRLKQTDYDGAFEYSPEVEVTVSPEGAFALSAPSPNPARGATTLTLTTSRAQAVNVAVYDLLGRRVAVALDRHMGADASQAITLDTSALPAGLYLVRATSAETAVTRRLTVLR